MIEKIHYLEDFMKAKILSLALISLSTFNSFAKDIDVRIEIPGDNNRRIQRELRECRINNDSLRKEINTVNYLLNDCRNNTESRYRIEQLQRENQTLLDHNRYLQGEVDRLRFENERLERELNPNRGGIDLAESIKACGKITNSQYARECAGNAKKYNLHASTILACTKITNSYYAAQCVVNAGENNANNRQVEVCTKITNSDYASQCVKFSGYLRVQPEVIQSCIETSTNSYYQLECVKSM